MAVYSDADAPHLRQADEALYIGLAPAALSCLRIDELLDAARRMLGLEAAVTSAA